MIEKKFQAAIAACGLTPPVKVIANGTLKRFSSNGRPHDDAGWYVLHSDGVPAGVFGCHRSGIREKWSSIPTEQMTPSQREAWRTRCAEIDKQRQTDLFELQKMAAKDSLVRWSEAQVDGDHPYLQAKGVKPYGIRTSGQDLLIPIRDEVGFLHSLQTISPEGEKRFAHGGRVAGCLHLIGNPEGVLIICEGYATGASIHEATGYAVAVAFNAGNLETVALALHRQYPANRIVLAADDDWKTEGNPGLTKAKASAKAVGGRLAVPRFPEGRRDKDTDFNDLHRLSGLGVVRDCIDAAIKDDPLTTHENVWSDPVPLPNALPEVTPFDPELLPESLRAWVCDIAHRMQCPPDYVSVGAVVAISSLIGARAVLAPKGQDDWRVVPNLWGLIVGRPGVMKSPALAQAMAPLHRMEAKERELWQEAHEAWKLDCKVADLAAKRGAKEAEKLAIKDPAKARVLLQPVEAPDEPMRRTYLIDDTTVEALADALTVNQWGLMVYRDELNGLICNMDRQGQEGSRGFYLTGYDGNQGYSVRRIGRGESYVPRVCLSMLGGMQPGRLQGYVRDAVSGGAGDDGLLQRFGLAVWPDITREWQWIDQWPDTPAKQTAWSVFERLAALQPATDTEPQEWRFSPEALAIYREWAESFEPEVRGDELHPALISHLSKYRKLIPALALIFALVDTPDNGNLIHERELTRALAWYKYLRSHAERIYTAAVVPDAAGAQTLLAKIKAGKLRDSDGNLMKAFTPRLVVNKNWTGLGRVDDVRKAADLLSDYGWLAREVVPTGPTGGRPSERYLICPQLLEGDA